MYCSICKKVFFLDIIDIFIARLYAFLSIKKWLTSTILLKRQDVEITRIRIGHCFHRHTYLISKDYKEPQPICDACHKALTIKHI